MKGSWCARRNAALVSSATRAWLTGFSIAHHAVFDGATSWRGGLGAEFCAITGRYSKAILVFSVAHDAGVLAFYSGWLRGVKRPFASVKYDDGCDNQSCPMVDVAANYRMLLQRIGAAAAKAGRNPEEVKLLGAAKSQNVELVRSALRAGVKLIGENYVQEAQDKKIGLSELGQWHMIGHLQRNKAKAAVEIFDVIESLDNIALARELDKEGSRQKKTVRVLVEVNLAGERSKSGIARDKVEDLLRAAGELSNVRIEGLMAVPPFHEDPEDVRPYFQALRKLRDRLTDLRIANVDLRELSMGMTHDYTVAVEEGATIVRVGTALFGPRA
jgi:pyridoxal phosphate enzyme (YggS family)